MVRWPSITRPNQWKKNLGCGYEYIGEFFLLAGTIFHSSDPSDRSPGAFFISCFSEYSGCLVGFYLIAQQTHFIGNYSLSIISVSGLFVGFVLGLQGYYVLVRYGSDQALGVMVALSLMRELGPVVAALLFAGRAGTSLTAEIGLMRSGEQLAAMEMMGVDPIRRIVVRVSWAR